MVAIKKLREIQLQPVAVVCDQASTNHSPPYAEPDVVHLRDMSTLSVSDLQEGPETVHLHKVNLYNDFKGKLFALVVTLNNHRITL